MTTQPSDMKPSERIFAGLPTWGECGDWEQWETIRRIAAYLDEQHAAGRGPELSLCPGCGELFQPNDGIGGHACSRCCDKPLRTDLYQEELASRFAAGESAAALQAAYGIDDGDLMRSLRDVLRRLLVPAVPVAGEPPAQEVPAERYGSSYWMSVEQKMRLARDEARKERDAARRVIATATARIKELTHELELAKPPPPFTANAATLRADCPTPGERPIMKGSLWLSGSDRIRVTGLNQGYVHWRIESERTGSGSYSRATFLACHTWVSDPPTPATGIPKPSAITINWARADMTKRQPGCLCQLEEGDSPCPLHSAAEDGGPDMATPATGGEGETK